MDCALWLCPRALQGARVRRTPPAGAACVRSASLAAAQGGGAAPAADAASPSAACVAGLVTLACRARYNQDS